MSTPLLSTAIRSRIEARDLQAQTAFPGKVTAFSASDNTATVEPQFIETWVTRAGERVNEGTPPLIRNVPVCFPHFLSWDIDPGTFGLVICTKYSLDKWRGSGGGAVDPGDLRRFTMSGATFHPVTMQYSPSVAQDFVALKGDVDDIKTYLDEIKQDFNAHTHGGVLAGAGFTGNPTASTPPTQITSTYTVQCSSKVKAEV